KTAAFLSAVTRAKPAANLQALHPFDDAYRQRIGAMEFTLTHDDGLGVDTIHQADLVLVGVSRTGKTPTSILLSQQGFRVANVSLAYGIEPPAALLSLPKQIVFGLTIAPSQLTLIRSRRQANWNMNSNSYDHPENVKI